MLILKNSIYLYTKKKKVIKELTIYNYAIIDKLSVVFGNKLNIITGETGAGKSILMGAIGLILGNRADTAILKDKNTKCYVEAIFENCITPELIDFLEQHNLDTDNINELILRREIATNAKTRAFVNDTPVNLQVLKQLSSYLVDQHQQFDNLLLSTVDFQQKIIDTLANVNDLLKEYKLLYSQWYNKKNSYEKLIKEKQDFNKEYDYWSFLSNEFEELQIVEDEFENLEKELNILSNTEEIKQVLNTSSYILWENEQAITIQLKNIYHQLSKIANHSTEIQTILERIKNAEIEIKDIARETEIISNNMHFDLERLNYINDRLSSIHKLLKKHNVTTTKELLEIQKEIDKKLSTVLNIDENIVHLEKELATLHKTLWELAKKISEKRKIPITVIEEKIHTLLDKVGMPNAKIKINILPIENITENGIDKIDFLFDANKSGHFENINKVASGGELSRLMLCIKYLVAESTQMPTLIFDEIDTGISGEAAKQVGIIMKDLSKNLQVISITHQPQIAAKADAHYFVYKKENEEGKIITNIKLLDQKERIEQIATLLGGNNKTDNLLKIAEEMINN